VDGKLVDQTELQILQEVMDEYGFEEPLNLEAKKKAEPAAVSQAVQMTKEQLIAALSDPNVVITPKTIAKINSLIKRNADFETSITMAVEKSLAGDASHTDEVLDIMLQDDTDQFKLSTYLSTRDTDGVDWTSFENKSTKVSTLFAKTGLSASTLGDFALYRWSATPQLGTIEVLLAVLLKGGSRPKKSGDLLVNDSPFEVGGFNKRLRAQGGLGTAEEAQEGFKQGYRKLAEDKGLLLSTFVSPSGTAKPASGPTFEVVEDNARYGSSRKEGWMSALEDMNKQLIELTKDTDDPVTKEELITAMSMGFGKALINRTSPSDWMWIKKHLKDDGTLNQRSFLIDFACYYLDYYMSMEEGNKMFIVTDASVSSAAPSKDSFSVMAFPANGDGLRPHIFTTIGLTIPSYRVKAGIQGVAFALKLGKPSDEGGELDEDLDYQNYLY
jgi:hypothetical protein